MSKKHFRSSHPKGSMTKRHLRLMNDNEGTNILQLLKPGSLAKLKNQPNDLPPFEVINCKGGRCLVRQQSWGKYVHWEVEHHRLKSA